MRAAAGNLLMNRYQIQPGDCTRYEFYLVPLLTFHPIAMAGYDRRVGDLGDVVAGVNEEFYTLGICMDSSQGSCEFRKSQLANPTASFIGYAAGKLRHVDKYTLVAVILAVSVLVVDPLDLEGAAAKMLEVPEWLDKLGGSK